MNLCVKRRKALDGVETSLLVLGSEESAGVDLESCLRDIRRRGGMTLHWALLQNVRTFSTDVKREAQVEGLHECESSEAELRVGVAHSSEETPVMGVERRGYPSQRSWSCQLEIG